MSDYKKFKENTTSVVKEFANGTILWRKQVMLDKSGNPLPLALFRQFVESAERVVLRDKICHSRFEKTPKERQLLKAYKKDHKQNMKALFKNRKDWKILARKHKIHNVPDDSKYIEQIQEQIL